MNSTIIRILIITAATALNAAVYALALWIAWAILWTPARCILLETHSGGPIHYIWRVTLM